MKEELSEDKTLPQAQLHNASFLSSPLLSTCSLLAEISRRLTMQMLATNGDQAVPR
jgi:hypothetical protein